MIHSNARHAVYSPHVYVSLSRQAPPCAVPFVSIAALKNQVVLSNLFAMSLSDSAYDTRSTRNVIKKRKVTCTIDVPYIFASRWYRGSTNARIVPQTDVTKANRSAVRISALGNCCFPYRQTRSEVIPPFAIAARPPRTDVA